MKRSIGWQAIADRIDRSLPLNGTPFEPDTPFGPPAGRWAQLVHYGLMIPGLPAPLRFLDVISILRQSGTRVFDNPGLLVTNPDDAALLLTGTGTTRDRDGQAALLSSLSIRRDCGLDPHGRHQRYADLTIAGSYPHFTITGTHRGVALDLQATTTDKVAHFAHLPGLYDHWSLLTTFTGRIEHAGTTVEIQDTLGTWEYARVSRPNDRTGHFLQRHPLPLNYFTYQILNLDQHTQALFVEVRGPRELPIQRRVYIRGLDQPVAVYHHGFSHTITDRRPTPMITPDGHPMPMPARFAWSVNDQHGEQVIAIDATANDDWVYGLGAGYAGSYSYTGTYRTTPIAGDAYIEHIDRRPTPRRRDRPHQRRTHHRDSAGFEGGR
jgi:hypothetical protein